MAEHENILKDHGRRLGELLQHLLVPEAGLPRPIISLQGDMPMLLPVNQETLQEFSDYVKERQREFHPPVLIFHLQPFRDPYHRKTITVSPPYAELTSGEPVERLDDPRPVKLARLMIRAVPPEWRNLRLTPLEALLQAQAKHRRHGTALGVGPTVPLRVPRQEIPGKATGI